MVGSVKINQLKLLILKKIYRKKMNREFWAPTRQFPKSNIHAIRVPERKVKEGGTEK